MAGKFKVLDKHRAMVMDIANGGLQWEAWAKHLGAPGTKKTTAQCKASIMMARPEMKALLKAAEQARNKMIINEFHKNLPAEFKTPMLSVEQMDAFHYAVAIGTVQVEELFPVTTIVKDQNGREVQRTTAIHRVKRGANIRERQASIDALYKRFGSYAPTKLFGAFKTLGEEEGEEVLERYILLSNGEKLPFPG